MHKIKNRLFNNILFRFCNVYRPCSGTALKIEQSQKTEVDLFVKHLKMNHLKLNSGQNIPQIGLGTWQADAKQIHVAVATALNTGYRHFDTAFTYNNEEPIGKALKEWISAGKGSREDLFITSKLPHYANRAEDIGKYLELSLKRLLLSYLDLYLVHHPFGFKPNEKGNGPRISKNGEFDLDINTNHVEIWKIMEHLVHVGLVKNIGLSNFNQVQIQNILNHCNIKPAVLQIELHLYMQQKQLIDFCHKNDITVTAYSPLGSPAAMPHFEEKYKYSQNVSVPLESPEVMEIARKKEKTPAQILLRFLIQQNLVVIPKSSNPNRIIENKACYDFDLSAKEMSILSNLDKGEKGRIFNFLFYKGVQYHPEYPFKRVPL